MPVRVLLVDDHTLFREGLALLLTTHGDFEVIGEASTGEEALSLTQALHPDLVVMDIRMPGMGGLEATRVLKRVLPQVRVVILTVSEEEADLFEAVRAGAQGYLLKDLSASSAVDLLRRAAEGEAVFTPRLASQVLLSLGRHRSPPEGLTPREREVLERVAQGLSNPAIARQLHISEATVRFHLRNILSKLHARSRTDAVVQAIRRRLLEPPPGEPG